ncbi:MAG: hypothetical protein KF716_05515 [Anaerolineae bacterium]|nr:hypothetical protein [Anaerolineae bacterium]
MATVQVSAYDDIMEFLTSSPTPEQIIEFRPSEAMQERVRYLLDENRTGTLTTEQRRELDEIEQIEHFMRRLKIYARSKLTVK